MFEHHIYLSHVYYCLPVQEIYVEGDRTLIGSLLIRNTSPNCHTELHSLCTLETRDTHFRDRRPSTAAYPACWAMGTKELKWYTVRKTIFCTWPTRPAKAEQNLLYRHNKLNKPTKEVPLFYTLWVPICLSLKSQQGQPHSSLSAGDADCTVKMQAMYRRSNHTV